MMNIIKDLIAKIKLMEPSMLAAMSAAPFILGAIAGYMLRGPIHLVLALLSDLAKLIMKL